MYGKTVFCWHTVDSFGECNPIDAGRLQRRKASGETWSTLLELSRTVSRRTRIYGRHNRQRTFLVSKLSQDPLEAILVIFGRRAFIFLFESSWKKWKMTPLLCACAVVTILETQQSRKRAPRSVEFKFFIGCDRHKRFSQNERRRADLQQNASNFLIFA